MIERVRLAGGGGEGGGGDGEVECHDVECGGGWVAMAVMEVAVSGGGGGGCCCCCCSYLVVVVVIECRGERRRVWDGDRGGCECCGVLCWRWIWAEC